MWSLLRRPLLLFSSSLLRFSFNFTRKLSNKITIPRENIQVSFARSSGAGGQNVNKVETKAEIRFSVQSANWMPEQVRERFIQLNYARINKEGELIITSSKTRSQSQNLSDCFGKLEELVEEASRIPKERIPTKVPDYAIEKRLMEKKKRSSVKSSRQRRFDDD